ncbi:MAG: DUF349 domain-containing protein [Cyclobacteriaceae bacterium]
MEKQDEKFTDPKAQGAEEQEPVQDKPELSEEVKEEGAKQEEKEPVEPEKPEAAPKAETQEESATESQTDKESSGSTDDDGHDDDHHDPLEDLHLENAGKQEVYQALKQFSDSEDMRLVDRALKEIKPYYDKLYSVEKDEALKAFLGEEGNTADDFQYKGDETDGSFFFLYNTLREKKQKYFSQLNKDKEQNLKRKNELLDQIRELVDGEETNTSIGAIKELQGQWKSIGQVPGQYAKTLWANYNALLDRFYDNRSIYFELKELDRKKNLEAKLELCVKAEALEAVENIKSAIHQLNELHEEFRHIGPVPKNDQEPLWERFKAASDNVYAKRKDFFEGLKSQLSENAKAKMAIGDEAEAFTAFNSEKISDWNKKTKQVLELQKKWDAIGGLPRESAKEINRHFWGNFKKFFANKNDFFKRLESEREGNLEKKLVLLKKAEELKESTDWDKTANDMKQLQQEWRNIGPLPEKHRNDVYQKFKAACDTFFDRKRSDSSGQGAEYRENLVEKEKICSMLEAYLNTDDIELDEVYSLLDQYAEVGFVPKESIDAIHARFDSIMEKLLGFEELTDTQRSELEIKIQVNKLKNSPHGAQKIQRKEAAVKRKMGELENEISTLKTNMEFFAESKTANKLKDEMQEKIEKAEAEISNLRKQLKVFRKL